MFGKVVGSNPSTVYWMDTKNIQLLWAVATAQSVELSIGSNPFNHLQKDFGDYLNDKIKEKEAKNGALNNESMSRIIQFERSKRGKRSRSKKSWRFRTATFT